MAETRRRTIREHHTVTSAIWTRTGLTDLIQRLNVLAALVALSRSLVAFVSIPIIVVLSKYYGEVRHPTPASLFSCRGIHVTFPSHPPHARMRAAPASTLVITPPLPCCPEPSQYVRKLSKATQKKLADAQCVAEESLSSMSTVRSFAAENETREAIPPTHPSSLTDLPCSAMRWSTCPSTILFGVTMQLLAHGRSRHS